ncbi:MAG: hypothetical protein Harvfovirus40_6 [Harvfovirus sp.]|uniref:Fatty acid desaturase domain-containing protein n=1 Tax=Harvfovirus sp. TaxID=2487768 RepID=A0A3G5A6S0_9VIRU|nr:MAG: hypothetical protein Harvfovirus40_6 [Harvfovirus sp.]
MTEPAAVEQRRARSPSQAKRSMDRTGSSGTAMCNIAERSECSKSSKAPWKHRQLSEEERRNYLNLYHSVEAKYALFNWLRKSDTNLIIWLLFIMSITGFATGYNFDPNMKLYSLTYSSFMIFCGMLFGTQPVFDGNHCLSHAAFLEYETYIIGNPRGLKDPIHYYADYHHHHTAADNWAPQLSYHNDQGSRNIIAAHWAGFTLFNSPKIIIFALVCYSHPRTLLYFSGYEIGALILPIAHGWQHIAHEKVPKAFRMLFHLFEFLGIVANKDDHGSHHNHNHRTVYQNFTSSGIYNKRLDSAVDKFWDWAYDKAALTPTVTKPYDIIKPYVTLIEIIALGLMPIFIQYMFIPSMLLLSISLVLKKI